MQPLISVVIPVYNQSKELAAALGSLKQQTYRHLEVIIVDDGSVPPVESFDSSLLKVRYVRQKNKGAPAARNKGFELSKGEYVIFWDADIVALDREMLGNMLAALKENPRVGYAYSDFYFGPKKMSAGAFDPDRLKKINYITTTSLIRREVFPGFDESLRKFQDWDLWLTVLEQGYGGVYVPGYLFWIKPGGTMSAWLPRFAYRVPWRYLPGIRTQVERYERAREVIRQKHGS
jgi:glycosyltransferase involved in cell wall biosynthesis